MEKIFKIDGAIYNKKFIKQWIFDFKEYGEIQFKNGDIIIFWEKESEIENIFNEFMNYIIALEC